MSSTTTTELSINQLKTISRWVSNVHNLNHLLEMILETGNRAMGASASSLLLLDKKTGTLQFKVATGAKKETVKKFEVKMGQGIAGKVAETGKPLLINDAARDNRWYSHISNQLAVQTKSIACVPMRLNNNVIGVIEFMNKIDGSAFQENELELLRVFADLAAVAIANARQFELVEKENQRLREELAPTHQIVGESKAIQSVIAEGMKVADSMASTLILGESGTGKEVLARLIHQASPRNQRPLITLNCAALSESLLEAELFGYEKGAFTGAAKQTPGKFELADNSTIFLDEIAEMSPQMQAKLLRVLQDGVFYRVGGNTPISVDIRVIAATNKKIAEAVQQGHFREDLYYRLNVVEIHMPPLRERKEDIPLLAAHFVQIFQKDRGLAGIEISDAALQKMMTYDWPGNVRELKNAVERAVVMGNGKQVMPDDLPMMFSAASIQNDIPVGLSLQDAVDAFKKKFIELNLKNTHGNQTEAAKNLGIQRSYLSRLISRYRTEKQN